MKLCLKITAGLLLLVQAFHLASLQITTDSPGRTIDRSWLRGPLKNTAGSQNGAVTEGETEYYQETTAMESSNDDTGVASGSMAEGEEGENVADGERDANETSDDLTAVSTTAPPTFLNATTGEPELPADSVSPTNETAEPSNSSRVNETGAEEEFRNSTTAPPHSTVFPDDSNRTDIQATTLAPESDATTQVTAANPEEENTGMTTDGSTSVTTPAAPEMNETTAASPSTTPFMAETAETTAAAPDTPEKANNTDKAAGSGSGSERGLASDNQRSQRQGAWGAVLGIAVAVLVVGLVAYIILKKKHRKGFSHRKLVEEYPSDPVLRLDNGEPLDLNFGGAAYYNPGLQGDNIQMSNIPGRR